MVAFFCSHIGTKKPDHFHGQAINKKGNDLLSHKLAVPSAQAGLTSLFGMGRGGHRRYSHLKTFNTFKSSYDISVKKIHILQLQFFMKSLRVISTARLQPSPVLHLQPINVIVFNDP